MPSPTVQIATGTTFTFGTSLFSIEFTGFSQSMSRESVDTTHLGSVDAMQAIPQALYDAGELTLDGHHNPDALPPINQPVEAITVTSPSGATFVANGFMTAHTATGAVGEKITASVTIKFTGTAAVTAAP